MSSFTDSKANHGESIHLVDGVGFQRWFQLAMETFYQSVGNGVVGGCADLLGTE